jgi:hypothetical protein
MAVAPYGFSYRLASMSDLDILPDQWNERSVPSLGDACTGWKTLLVGVLGDVKEDLW